MEFRVLGTLEVTDGGRPVEVSRAKLRAVLAVLVLHPNQVVATDLLTAALWGESPPASATNTLQGYVSHLRRALGTGRIVTRAPGYMLSAGEDAVDARRFERVVAQARRVGVGGDAETTSGLLTEALALWRGPALADLLNEPFAAAEAARLEQLRIDAVEDLGDAELALGRHADIAGSLGALVEEHPLRERLWGQLMLSLYRCGRQAEALRAFQTARGRLGDELGIEPSPALCRLEAAVLAQSPSLDWRSRPSPAPADGNHRRHLSEVPFPGLLSATPGIGYVGRKQLLDVLGEACQQVATGRCQAVLLVGEPGVGKTRTAAEVALAAFSTGFMVLYGRCDEDIALPYQPFAEALDWYTAHAVDPVLGGHPGELVRLQPLLASRVAGLADPVSSDPRSEEYLLFEATTSWLIELARQRPVVLVLDDLHWASKPVLLLLRHVLRRADSEEGGVRLLVVGTYRDTEVDRSHPLAEVMADLRQLPTVDQVTIVGLTPAEVEEFVCRAAGHALGDDDVALARTLHADTEGNPFFVGEVLRHLAEGGTAGSHQERRLRGEGSASSLPDGVRNVVGRRLGRLSADANRLLSTAAVLGRDFDVDLLDALSDAPEGVLLDALDEAVQARLIEESAADRYRFAHALVRSTLLDRLSVTRRRRVHRRAGHAYEKLHPEDVVALAHHFTEAGGDGSDRAAAYALAAAERALAARALADAEARFATVLELLAGYTSDGAERNRIRAMCGLGEAQRDQGDNSFRATLLEAGRLAEAVGDVPMLVRAALNNSRGVPGVIGGCDADRVALAEAALERIGPSPSADRARLLAQVAAEITFTRDHERRLSLTDEAEAMARDLGDAELLAWVLNRTGYAAFSAGRVDGLVERGREATELSDAGADPAQRVLGRYFWAGALLAAGDVTGFRQVTLEMLVVSEEASPTLQWLAQVTQARLCQLDGDFPGMRRINDAAFLLAQDLGEPDGPAWWGAIHCPHEWFTGRFESVLELLRSGVEQYPEESAWRIAYALCLAMSDRPDEARAALTADVPSPDELLHHPFPFFNLQALAFAAFFLEDAELATGIMEALSPHRRCFAHHYGATFGPTGLALALCAAVVGDLDGAVALCEGTESLLINPHCEGMLPVFRLFHADVLLRRDSGADRTHAGQLLDEVRREAVRFQSPQLIKRVDALLGRRSSPPTDIASYVNNMELGDFTPDP